MAVMRVCRLCLKVHLNESVFLILNENGQLIDLISQFLQIEVAENWYWLKGFNNIHLQIFPDSLEDYYLCNDCHKVLQDFNEFKTKCAINDLEFRTRYQFNQELSEPSETESDVEQTQKYNCSVVLSLNNETSTEFGNADIPTKPDSSDVESNDTHNKASKTKPAYVRDRRKLPCHVCGKLISNAAYTVHVALHNADSERFECQICNRSYRQKHNLTKHLNTHTKKVLFPCKAENCGKVFDVASTLRKHFQIMHTNVRDHGCSICGKRFAIASGLRGHMRTKHCTEKIHGCPECGKMFKTP